MRIFVNPDRSEWPRLQQRPVIDAFALQQTVRSILQEVKQEGDSALQKFTLQFDKAAVDQWELSGKEIQGAVQAVVPELREAIEVAIGNITRFHEWQQSETAVMETMPGIRCWRRSAAIEKVGLYIPGGTAPLFSTVLMLAIPARLAGCREIVLCTPPAADGSVNPAIIYAAQRAGVNRIFRVGGVQAIAAMAYGTASIPAVYKIFGPGNQFVNCAKQLVQMDGIAIDMPAGPSEVCVMADGSASPAFVAADLLSQAEHGSDSQVVLVCDREEIVQQVLEEIDRQLPELPRRALAAAALEQSLAVVLPVEEDRLNFVNSYAAEHLIIACERAIELAARIENAGSVFVGHFSPESAGDYASGTNHTLPTNGFARSFSGVSLDSFVKKITFQQLSPAGLEAIGESVITMADAEGLAAHGKAVSIRLKSRT